MKRHQKLVLELISLAKHNDLIGSQVAKDLRDNPHLWVSAYGYFSYGDKDIRHLIPLRDMTLNWHIDSVALTCKKEHKKALKALIKTWNPSEIYVYKDKKDGFYEYDFLYFNGTDVLIEVWWD